MTGVTGVSNDAPCSTSGPAFSQAEGGGSVQDGGEQGKLGGNVQAVSNSAYHVQLSQGMGGDGDVDKGPDGGFGHGGGQFCARPAHGQGPPPRPMTGPHIQQQGGPTPRLNQLLVSSGQKYHSGFPGDTGGPDMTSQPPGSGQQYQQWNPRQPGVYRPPQGGAPQPRMPGPSPTSNTPGYPGNQMGYPQQPFAQYGPGVQNQTGYPSPMGGQRFVPNMDMRGPPGPMQQGNVPGGQLRHMMGGAQHPQNGQVMSMNGPNQPGHYGPAPGAMQQPGGPQMGGPPAGGMQPGGMQPAGPQSGPPAGSQPGAQQPTSQPGGPPLAGPQPGGPQQGLQPGPPSGPQPGVQAGDQPGVAPSTQPPHSSPQPKMDAMRESPHLMGSPHGMMPGPMPVLSAMPTPSTPSKMSNEGQVLARMCELGSEPERRPFLERLFRFSEQRGQPITAMPMISKSHIDLYRLYVLVKERGGLWDVTKAKKWRDICTSINCGTSGSAGFTLRRNYIKYLFHYECHFDRGGIDPAPIIAQVESLSKKDSGKRERASTPGGQANSPSNSNSQDSFRPGQFDQQFGNQQPGSPMFNQEMPNNQGMMPPMFNQQQRMSSPHGYPGPHNIHMQGQMPGQQQMSGHHMPGQQQHQMPGQQQQIPGQQQQMPGQQQQMPGQQQQMPGQQQQMPGQQQQMPGQQQQMPGQQQQIPGQQQQIPGQQQQMPGQQHQMTGQQPQMPGQHMSGNQQQVQAQQIPGQQHMSGQQQHMPGQHMPGQHMSGPHMQHPHMPGQQSQMPGHHGGMPGQQQHMPGQQHMSGQQISAPGQQQHVPGQQMPGQQQVPMQMQAHHQGQQMPGHPNQQAPAQTNTSQQQPQQGEGHSEQHGDAQKQPQPDASPASKAPSGISSPSVNTPGAADNDSQDNSSAAKPLSADSTSRSDSTPVNGDVSRQTATPVQNGPENVSVQDPFSDDFGSQRQGAQAGAQQGRPQMNGPSSHPGVGQQHQQMPPQGWRAGQQGSYPMPHSYPGQPPSQHMAPGSQISTGTPSPSANSVLSDGMTSPGLRSSAQSSPAPMKPEPVPTPPAQAMSQPGAPSANMSQSAPGPAGMNQHGPRYVNSPGPRPPMQDGQQAQFSANPQQAGMGHMGYQNRMPAPPYHNNPNQIHPGYRAAGPLPGYGSKPQYGGYPNQGYNPMQGAMPGYGHYQNRPLAPEGLQDSSQGQNQHVAPGNQITTGMPSPSTNSGVSDGMTSPGLRSSAQSSPAPMKPEPVPTPPAQAMSQPGAPSANMSQSAPGPAGMNQHGPRYVNSPGPRPPMQDGQQAQFPVNAQQPGMGYQNRMPAPPYHNNPNQIHPGYRAAGPLPGYGSKPQYGGYPNQGYNPMQGMSTYGHYPNRPMAPEGVPGSYSYEAPSSGFGSTGPAYSGAGSQWSGGYSQFSHGSGPAPQLPGYDVTSDYAGAAGQTAKMSNSSSQGHMPGQQWGARPCVPFPGQQYPGTPPRSTGMYSPMHRQNSKPAYQPPRQQSKNSQKKEIHFPPESVEAVQPRLIKRRKITNKDLGPQHAWRLMLALKSGLLAESTWALDVLTVHLHDDHSVQWYGLQSLPGLVDLLCEHWRRVLKVMFPEEFSDLDLADDRLASDPLSYEALDGEREVPELNPKLAKVFHGADYSMRTRTGKTVQVTDNPVEEDYVRDLKTWDVYNGASTKTADFSHGPVELTSHIVTHMHSHPTLDYLRTKFFGKHRRKSADAPCDSAPSDAAEDVKDADLAAHAHVKTEPRTAGASSGVPEGFSVTIKREMDNGSEGTHSDSGISSSSNMSEDSTSSVVKTEPGDAKDVKRDSSASPVTMETEAEDASTPHVITEQGLDDLKRKWESADEEQEAYMKDTPPLCLVEESHDELSRRCVCLSNIIRSLSFIPGNEQILSQHVPLVRVLSRLLLLHHRHPRRRVLARPPLLPAEQELAERPDLPGEQAAGEAEDDAVSSHTEWWWGALEAVRENVLVVLANICSHMDCGKLTDLVCLPLLDGLLHWGVCPSAVAQDPLPACLTLSAQRLAMEAITKLCVLPGNVDLLLATPPFSRVVQLCAVLVRLIGNKDEQVLREFAITILSQLVLADLAVARAIALQPSALSLLVDFIELAEENAHQVVSQHGMPTLREHPEMMGTSLDLIRRAASTLDALSQVPDNKALFSHREDRLLKLCMSQVLDYSVTSRLAEVLYNCREAQLDPS